MLDWMALILYLWEKLDNQYDDMFLVDLGNQITTVIFDCYVLV